MRWRGDLTEIPNDGGLLLGLDPGSAWPRPHSRRCVGFVLDNRYDAAVATVALQVAIAVRGGSVTGVVFHTAQGGETRFNDHLIARNSQTFGAMAKWNAGNELGIVDNTLGIVHGCQPVQPSQTCGRRPATFLGAWMSAHTATHVLVRLHVLLVNRPAATAPNVTTVTRRAAGEDQIVPAANNRPGFMRWRLEPRAVAGEIRAGEIRKSAMSLHMTPNHWDVLSTVRDGRIGWRDSEGPFGGFTMVDGTRIVPGHDLVALYELRNAGLIAVNTKSGHVTATAHAAVWIRRLRLRKAS